MNGSKCFLERGRGAGSLWSQTKLLLRQSKAGPLQGICYHAFRAADGWTAFWLDCQADLTCADKHSLSLGHLNPFLHHPLMLAFCLKASALPLFCLLFFPKENTSQPEREGPPHVTFNLNISFSILTREPYLVQLLWLRCGLEREKLNWGAWLTSLLVLLYFSFLFLLYFSFQSSLTSPQALMC